MLPELKFIYIRPKSHYLWIKDNPKFSIASSMDFEELSEVVLLSARKLDEFIQPYAEKIFRQLEELSGYSWIDNRIKVYPTFLGPSYSDPLSLRVTEVSDGKVIPSPIEKTSGILIHELAHNIMPLTLFLNFAMSEQVMDLTTFKIMEDLGIDSTIYREWSDKITSEQQRYIPNTLTAEALFNPSVQSFLEKYES